MSKFVELIKREYYRCGYISVNMCVSLDDIARVVQCMDDYDCTNIITKDGKIYTLNEKYGDVIKKITQAEREVNRMDDLISRQAAIDTIYKRIKQIGYEDNPLALSIRQAIRDLPSIQPEQHWIPWSDWILPKDSG